MSNTAGTSNLIGRTLGNYQITEQIGQGGMATVYKAFQFTIDRYVAVKVLPSQFATDPNFVKRFEHEAKAIAALEHPHILPVHDFGVEGNLYYMVMRYIEGGTLSELMGQAIPYEQIVQHVGDIARALDYAHRQGVVHRDIKPSNMLIDQHGEILLTDFGIAKIVEGSNSTQLTATGHLIGTPAYMAPEQAQGSKVDGRSDIYSLGVVLYELLTGQPPYQAETPLAIALKHISEPLPPPRLIKPNLPEAFEGVVLKAMAKEPEHRFDTAEQMAQALQMALKSSETGQTSQPLLSPDVEPTQLGQIATPTASEVQAVDQPVQSKVDEVPTPSSGNSRSLWWVAGGVAILVALVALGLGGWFLASFSDQAEVAEVVAPVEDSAEPEEPALNPERQTDLDEADNSEIEENLFEDNFSDNSAGLWLQETIQDELGLATTQIDQGRYSLEVIATSDEGNYGQGELLSQAFDDFSLTVDVFPTEADADFEYGVFFRDSTEVIYYFGIEDDEFYVTSLIDQSQLELVEFTSSDILFEQEPFELTIEAIGPNLSFFIDGELVATATEEDDPGEAGTIGFYIDLFEEDEVKVEFDNVLIETR